MKKLRSLWFGELPLGEAFWTWAICVGLVVNLTTSALFLAMIAADLPWLALLFGYALSVPYNVLAVVGVWRSAGRYRCIGCTSPSRLRSSWRSPTHRRRSRQARRGQPGHRCSPNCGAPRPRS